jgi:hypothetical protein
MVLDFRNPVLVEQIGAICDIGTKVEGNKPLVNNIW